MFPSHDPEAWLFYFKIMDELIKLAKEKGFETKIDYVTQIKDTPYKTKEEIEYWEKFKFYIWMCELRKWLMDEKSIFIEISIEDIDYFIYTVRDFNLNHSSNICYSGSCLYFETSLHESLTDALKLI